MTIEQARGINPGLVEAPQDAKALSMLPCPFCGQEPKLTERPSTDGEGGGFSCFIACYCGGYSACAHKMGRGPSPEEAKMTALAAWNMRTN